MIHDSSKEASRDLFSDRRRKYFKPTDVADYFEVSRSTIYELIRAGEMASIKIGRSVRIPRDEIVRFERGRLGG